MPGILMVSLSYTVTLFSTSISNLIFIYSIYQQRIVVNNSLSFFAHAGLSSRYFGSSVSINLLTKSSRVIDSALSNHFELRVRSWLKL